MNEFSLFEQNEKVTTVKELAIELRVAESTVKNIITELRQVVGGVFENIKRNSQNGYLLNEKQATAIKLKLRQRNNLKDNSAVMQIGNDLEFFALLKKRDEEQKELDAYRDRRIAELTAENEMMKPKAVAYDDFIARDKFCNFRDASNYLGISQTELMNVLKSKYIYKNSVGEYRAYSDYTKYFTLRPFDKGYDKVGQQLMMNLEGLEYFKSKIGGISNGK